MTYDQSDLATLERHAFANGDTLIAELAGLALGHEEETERSEQLQSIIDGIEQCICEANWRTGKKAELRELIEAIRNEIIEGKG